MIFGIEWESPKTVLNYFYCSIILLESILLLPVVNFGRVCGCWNVACPAQPPMFEQSVSSRGCYWKVAEPEAELVERSPSLVGLEVLQLSPPFYMGGSWSLSTP